MSLHSRSSSEMETTPYSDIIPVFRRDLHRDFDFNDVKHKVKSLFTAIEYDYIEKETGEAQILHLIWVLQNKSDVIITQFLEIIKEEYNWIVDRIREEINDHKPDTIRYLENLKSIQRDNQNHTDYNVHRTKQFLKLRSALRKLNPKSGLNSVIILGDLGSGKKWLSLDVISDYDVLKSMNFKIFWIDCALCTSLQEDYNALKILMLKLNPQYTFGDCQINENLLPNMIMRLKEQIKLILESKEYRNCLLVLANVRNVKCQEAFNLGCKRLIITRNKKVSDSLSTKLNTHITLEEGLKLKEFYLLLDKYITSYNWRVDNSGSANDIFYMSNGDPYMLSIIVKNLKEKKSNWHEWLRNLNNFQIPDVKFQRDVENSLKILTPQQLQLYASLAIFQYCAQIPVKLLAYLWNKQLFEAEEIITKFHINSFVQKNILDDNDTIVCSLKYVYSSYLKNSNKIQKLINPQELHARIIDYYQIEEHLNIRKDVDLDFGAQHDSYFFRWIGYHIYGAQYVHLFPKLYKDFGFLGQKMRSVGLHNTLADLRCYDREISFDDRTYSFKQLKAFLAKIEEKILHYPDCCLLQYALLSEDFIKDLALQQIEKFPRRVWFTERGQYHQRRFTISLPYEPKLLRILEHDLCIVVLNNDDVYLMDLSLDSTCNLLQLVESTGTAIITDIQVFDQKNYILIINNYGQLKLWDISVEKRHILNQRRGSDASSYDNNYSCCNKRLSARSYKQNINDYISYFNKIVAFNLVKNDSKDMLYVALDSGFVRFFDWQAKSKEFKGDTYQIPLQTGIKNIHSICNIRQTHFMIIHYDAEKNNSLNVTFLNRINTEKETKTFDWPQNAQLVYYKVCGDVIIFVFNRVVLRLTLSFRPFDGHLELLYTSPDCLINCGKLLIDNQYLMLGTEKGLLIYDIKKRAIKLHSSVSENISCLDNYDLDDDEYKSMIVCGCTNKTIVYIFGLRMLNDETLVWEHSCIHRFEEMAHLEHHKNTRFLGKNLFDVSQEHETLYAVDLTNRTHQICCTETKNWSILPSLDTNQKIIAIKCFKDSVLVALENGDIYDLQEQRLVFKAPKIVVKQVLLKTVNENILITSSAEEMTYLTDITNEAKKEQIKVLTKYVAMVYEKYLLIVNNYGAVLFVDCEINNFPSVCKIGAISLLADCDLKNNILFLGFSDYNVHIYSLEKARNVFIECRKRCEIKQNNNDLIITCIKASDDAKLFAIGLKTETNTNGLRSCGDIEIFKLNDDFKEQLLYCLKSHVSPISDLLFSPQNDVLVSVAEQICFWNINYILNNPLDVGSKKRHSSRFTSQKSAEEVDFKVVCQQERRDRFLNFDYAKHSLSFDNLKLSSVAGGGVSSGNNSNSLQQSMCSDDLNDSVFDGSMEKMESIWSYLHGPSDKPELFSCLKLDGNEAKQIFSNKDFTEFYTIDDEGVYYNLKLIKLSTASTPDNVDTQDSSSSSYNNMEYLQIHRLSVASSTMSGADVVDTAANT